MPKVTQKTIAVEAGVSRSTVAAVLNDFNGVSIGEEKRRRVLEAIERLGYSPNRFAQAIRGGRTRMIGVLHKSGGRKDRWMGRLISSMVAEIRRRNYDFVVNDIHWFEDDGEASWKFMLDANPEGLVLVSPMASTPRASVEEAKARGLPIVCAGGALADEFPSFDLDMREASRALTDHVLSGGKRRPRLVLYRAFDWSDGGREFAAARNHFREQGFLEACEARGIPSRDREVLDLPAAFAEGHSHYVAGKITMERLLESDAPPDAVFFKNDRWAIGALTACHERGIRVPEDVAVAGYQNDEFGEYTNPPLTTIDPPCERIAEAAAGKLFRLIDATRKDADGDASGNPEKTPPVRFPCALVVRQSTPAPAMVAGG